jgi:threonine synthase
MVYYFHAIAQLAAMHNRRLPEDGVVVSTPSGNFGNLTAGLMAKRAGLPIARFVAATNANDVVPAYLETGRFEPRPSLETLSNAMDVGHPSNFERMLWLYGGDLDAMRHDITGVRHTDDDVRETIRQVYERSGYLLDPHGAIGYKGLQSAMSGSGSDRIGVFLATAHPAKFAEIVDPIVGHPVEKPEALANALARPRHIIRIDATREAVRGLLTNDE